MSKRGGLMLTWAQLALSEPQPFFGSLCRSISSLQSPSCLSILSPFRFRCPFSDLPHAHQRLAGYNTGSLPLANFVSARPMRFRVGNESKIIYRHSFMAVAIQLPSSPIPSLPPWCGGSVGGVCGLCPGSGFLESLDIGVN